ncbi:hypothetical protein B4099_3701 [Heyndrickxia coagulans]|uniref:Uncharacterized protein n=1 Tax=Heyndrickxia coagulans TaxID=1398 RepID=A0A150KG42_HEYCO|nr:hypothetical protein B4099_3701 [Heyndrickxia coagulans]
MRGTEQPTISHAFSGNPEKNPGRTGPSFQKYWYYYGTVLYGWNFGKN